MHLTDSHDVNSQPDIVEKTVTFGSHGLALNGRILMPAHASKHSRVPGAVFCHGYGNDQDAFEHSARILAAEGIATFAFDFRGHGESEGILDGHMVEDVIDAWDYLRDQPEVDHKRMGLIGHSMGAFSAIMAAGKLKKAKALVALSCPGEIHHCIAGNPNHFAYPLLRHLIVLIFKINKRFCNLKVRVNWKKFVEFWPKNKLSKALAGMEGCSKLFVFCLNDIASPYNRFLYSYAMASEPKQVMVTTGNHGAPLENEVLRAQWQKWVIGALIK